MFYCETCRVKAEWPKSLRGFPDSYGRCEMCYKTAECYDVPSCALPIPKDVPKPKPKGRRAAIEHTKAKRSSSDEG